MFKSLLGTLIYSALTVTAITNTAMAGPVSHKSEVKKAIPQKNVIIHHVTFPYQSTQKADLFSLGTPYANTVIESNLIAGVMYGHLLKEKYPDIQFDKDYLYGTLLGQLLQESGLSSNQINTKFDAEKPTQAIHNEQTVKILLSGGQGGPYQINDYAKRLGDTNGSALGLINYDAVRTTLGYTIADQDSGVQTSRTGPSALEDIYFGPMATAFYHFNDVNRITSLADSGWYSRSQLWKNCFNNITSGDLSSITNGLRLTDIVMNVIYNAGTYSEPLTTYLKICESEDPNELKYINDYSLNPTQYRQKIGSKGSSGATYYRYTRQVSFYLDQLYGKDMSQYGVDVTNDVHFTAGNLEQVFVRAIDQLSYMNKSDAKLTLITKQQATSAFENAQSSLGYSANSVFKLNDANSRSNMFALINAALSNVESSTKTRFSAFTNSQPTPPPSNVPKYSNGTHYNKGDYVWVGSKSHVYQCKQPAWCSFKGSAYSLPNGNGWQGAWVKLS
ncbi:hypothetical protein M9194_00430 [Vibrio sp. S4M6]|uniref:hypothetical protein n=1 Tax=Vibrio sinus TaxID=2946865 RepID=UPI00202A55B1|nr:hypothetical protein [Vibrio sinus]MCL9779898.1 hypothetical protein [Vibrio sinus]